MTTYTRIPAAQNALKAALDTRAAANPSAWLTAAPGGAPTAVTRTLGWPVRGLEVEHVWVGGEVDGWTQEFEVTPQAALVPARDEQFTLTVNVFASRSDGDYTLLRDRVFVLVAEVEAAIGVDVTLGHTIGVAHVAGGKVQEGVHDKGREMLAEVFVACRAQLNG